MPAPCLGPGFRNARLPLPRRSFRDGAEHPTTVSSASPLPPDACPSGLARIHLLHPLGGSLDAARALLPDGELERASRFHFPRDAEAWITWRAGLRRILAAYLATDPAEVSLQAGPSDKPLLAAPHHGLHFNLSHSHQLAAVIVSRDGPVGIDLEPLDRAASLPECREEFCHPDEIARLPEDPASLEQALLAIWVAKEALLKALGTGLGFPPQQLQIVGDRGHTRADLQGLGALKLATPADLPDHLMAVAVPLSVHRFDLVDD